MNSDNYLRSTYTSHKPYLLFVAQKSFSNPRKGTDLLESILSRLSKELQFELIIVGSTQSPFCSAPFPLHLHGSVTSEHELACLYNIADVLLLPSQIDNAPQVATESIACGTPVCSFDVGGLSDIVISGKTGLLAPLSRKQFSLIICMSYY